MEFENNAYFWQKIDTLYLSSDVVIDKPKNSVHPEYTNLIYPVDYGYLQDALLGSDEKIHVYVGTRMSGKVDAILVCADILKKDMDVKFLVGCTKQEEREILNFLNQTDFQKSVLLRRGHSIPDWASEN